LPQKERYIGLLPAGFEELLDLPGAERDPSELRAEVGILGKGITPAYGR